MAEPDYAADMRLPEGRTCADCVHGPRCDALFGAVRSAFTSCDFWPSQFIPIVGPRAAVLTDADILAVLARRADGEVTYVIRNSISMAAHAAGDQAKRRIKTSQVRQRLYRLEREGRVERVPNTYAVMICWRLKALADAS